MVNSPLSRFISIDRAAAPPPFSSRRYDIERWRPNRYQLFRSSIAKMLPTSFVEKKGCRFRQPLLAEELSQVHEGKLEYKLPAQLNSSSPKHAKVIV
jgi:hypothetical protein